jgi:guanine deaminase
MAFRNADPVATSLEDLADRTFALIVMGDDRAITATYIMGNLHQG